MLKHKIRPLSFSDFQAPTSCSEFFRHLPVLETERLRLRPFRRADAKDVFAYASDEEVARYELWDAHQRLSETRGYLAWMRQQYRNGQPASWAIELRESKLVIGSIGFMWVSEEHRSGEIGYSLARSHWNQGLTTEALRAVLSVSSEKLRLHRIEAQCDVRNPASGRVLEKCGMSREGVLHHRLRNKGEYIDVALYAVVYPESRSVR